MSKVMIVLVSAQRMQNIIPVYQEDMGLDDSIVPIISKKGDDFDSFFVKVYRQIQDALRDKVRALDEQLTNSVRPMFPADTRAVCDRLLNRFADREVIINFTGGLKPMAIGAFLAGEACARMMYVDTENEQLLTFEPNDQVSVERFNEHVAAINAEVYLLAHGKKLDLARIRQNAFSETDLQAGFRLGQILDQSIPFFDILRTVGSAHFSRRRGQAKQQSLGVPLNELGHVPCDVFDIICPQYATLEHRSGGDVLVVHPGSQWNFLTGGWFEAYVYRVLRDSNLFHDVRSRVYLEGMPDDLDAVCVYNARLAILECKSGGERRGRQAPLHRLNMLQGSLAGIFGKGIFVTSRRCQELGSRFLERAKETRTKVIDLPQLPSLAEEVHQRLKEPR